MNTNTELDVELRALAGYAAGVHVLGSGERVLVREGPKVAEPVAGEWETIRRLIEGRLGEEQSLYFHAWCKVAAESLRAGEPGNWRAGHVMILTGPPACGKSLLQREVITPLLGGRMVHAVNFFSGGFLGADVCCGEHLVFDEMVVRGGSAALWRLREGMKRVVAAEGHRMKLPRREACAVSPFWRMTMSATEGLGRLRWQPLMTEDLADKVLILRCAGAELPLMVTHSADEQRRLREVLAAEIPHYLEWLLNGYVIPEELLTYADGRDATRFGFREYHAPMV